MLLRDFTIVGVSNLYTMGVVGQIDPRRRLPPIPCVPSEATRLLRARLILEEAIETINALGFTIVLPDPYVGDRLLDWVKPCDALRPNLLKIIDGCCDLDYVATGTLLACGVPDQTHKAAVCVANDKKFPNGIAALDGNGKFQKPAGWVDPERDHESLVGCQTLDLYQLSQHVVESRR